MLAGSHVSCPIHRKQAHDQQPDWLDRRGQNVELSQRDQVSFPLIFAQYETNRLFGHLVLAVATAADTAKAAQIRNMQFTHSLFICVANYELSHLPKSPTEIK